MSAFILTLPRYQCHKQVSALKIAAIIPNPRGVELHFDCERYAPIQMPDDWVNKHAPQPGGYMVWYDTDSYISYSPAAAFEAGYTLIEEGNVGRLVVLREDFEAGQWWVKELEAAVANGTLDQKRAVAVVRNLLRQIANGGLSDVESALASRDAEIERLRARLNELSKAFDPKTAPEAWLQEQCAVEVGQLAPVEPVFRDSTGLQIRPGDTLTWEEQGTMSAAKVEADPTYNGGMRVGGKSLPYLIEFTSRLRRV